MTSAVERDSLTDKPRSDVNLQVADDSVLKEVRSEAETNTKAKIKPGVYIALEGGRLVPCPEHSETLISSLSTASRSIDLPIKISETLTLSPSCVRKVIITKKLPFIQKGNSGVKKVVQVAKNPTEESLYSVSNIKHKADIEIDEQRKKFKLGTSCRDSHSNYVDRLANTYEESKFKCQTGEDFSCTDSFAGSEKKRNSVPECTYETQKDVDLGKGDHDYGQYSNPEIRRGLYENQEENLNIEEVTEDQSVKNLLQDEDFNEEYEEEIIEDETVHNSSLEGLNEENEVELNESQSFDSSTQEIQSSSVMKQHVPLKTSFQLNNHGKTPAGESQLLIPCTSKSVGAAVRKAYEESAQNRRPRVNDKFPQVPVPAHINQYGDCLKTRLGRCHYGLTLNDPPCQFFQGVLKGTSGQTLAAMFGDVNLIAKFESVSVDEIGHFVIDTTFKVTPNSTEGVNQVFTISLLHQNVVIPLWYAITSCSSPELYKRILIEFQQHVLDWPFTSVLVNNDPALCKAVQAVFPDVDIYGSWFHYCYSIWKEVNLLNLTEQCKAENSTLLKAVKLLMVVPYLPPSAIDDSSSVIMEDGFKYVREFARENNLPKEFNRVLDYIAEFWFNKVKPENFTLFGKHTFSLNHIEVLQLLLLSYMKQDGNVWVLTRSFQSIARSTYTDFIRYLNGKRQISKKYRGKKFNVPIRLNMKKLMAGSLDVKTYLEKSTIYLEEILDIFLHPVYPTTTFEKTNYIHTEGWAVKICSD